MSEVEKKDESDEGSNDGVFIYIVSLAVSFLWAILNKYPLSDTAAIAPVLGLVVSFVFVGIRSAVRKILKK
jgi:UDP-N-acetylmuramyl pentapeptide phosphotransferase/UDP-N-acetylglucosamine-1-phosphate transferase